MRLKKSRVPSSEATSKTILSRNRELSHHRRVCSGGDQVFQLSKEIKALSLDEREKILEVLQDGCRVQIPTTMALAMKADLSIPWCKLRAIRR